MDKETLYLDEVRWIKEGLKPSDLREPDILTSEEVERMIEYATNLRDKALIVVLYGGDSG